MSPADRLERLSTLKRETDLLTRAAQYVLAERVYLAQSLPYAPAPTTPCLGLPNELLSYIFEVGCTNPEPNSRPDEYDAFRDTIGATCKAFRSILLKSPRCWSTIKYRVEFSFSTLCHSRLEQRVQLLLSRSENCAIRICLYARPGRREKLPLGKISAILRPHLCRCVSLDVATDDTNITRLFPRGAMPRLRQTRIQYFHPRSIEFHFFPWVIQDNPVLQSLWMDIRTLSSIGVESFESFPGATLMELHMEGVLPGNLMVELLSRCSALERLYWDSWSHVATTHSTITLPSLTQLDFNAATGSVLGHIEAPELREISFSSARGEEEPGSSSRSLFSTKKPFSRLHKLQLVSYDRESLPLEMAAIIPSFISLNPTIAELHLFPFPSTPAATTRRITGFLDRLHYNSPRQMQCPSLTYLFLAVPDAVWKSHFFPEINACIRKLLTRLDKTFVALSYNEVKDSDYAKGKVPLIGNLLDQFPGRIQIAGNKKERTLWWS